MNKQEEARVMDGNGVMGGRDEGVGVSQTREHASQSISVRKEAIGTCGDERETGT